ncbi:hypothetical protein M0G43_10895 [Subsaxibacter sp. CAU 1640]|uniref:hypothetical protein n=1 Tax=Subsaxibacter sp. CAU 1640 TaxID=2933271 RepID=UPI002004B503|nr:hypothetical protein [Subsaxibacter sp. CAU 1640]MCK7591082.1 hypothetical protein [Subsaxibacter sp. CAU 1640]
MKNLTIIFTFLITLTGYAQSNYSKWKTEKFENKKIYVDLKNALENPLSVKILDLGGQNLTEIPKSIKEFKNLQVLLLGWRPKKYLDSSIIKMAQNIGGGYFHLDRNRGIVLDYNKIQQLPS